MHKQAVVPAAIEHLPLPFTPAVRSGDLVFVSGQASVDRSGAVVAGTFEQEMRRSMDNLGLVLEASGCGLDDVLQVRAYVGDVDDVPRYNELYGEYFGAPLPARTTLVNCLGSLRFEIDAIARCPRRQQ